MNDTSRGVGPKKADVILNRTEKLLQQSSSTITSVDSIARYGAKSSDVKALLTKVDEEYHQLTAENASLKKDVKYLSAQVESVYICLSKMLESLPAITAAAQQQTAAKEPEKAVNEEQTPAFDIDELASRVAEKIYIPSSSTPTNIDYDKIGVAVANHIHIPEALVEDIDLDALAEKLKGNITVTASDNGEIDYDKIGIAVANNIHIPEALVEDIDLDALAEKLKGNITVTGGEAQEFDYDKIGVAIANNIHIPKALAEDIDLDELAAKLTEAMPVQEAMSPDYIASKVAEQIVIPQPAQTVDSLDIEELSRKVADKVVIPAYDPLEITVDEDRIAYAVAEKIKAANEESKTAEAVAAEDVHTDSVVATDIDEKVLADEIADRLNVSLTDEAIASAVVKNLADAIDNELIADCVAKKVGSIAPDQFDIMVDDDGCDALANAIHDKLDYETLAAKIVEKIPSDYFSAGAGDIDTEELAKVLSEKLSVSVNVNEDEIADKAAAVLSNYLPEMDTDEIAEKVVAGVVPSIPAAETIDYEELSRSVSQQIVENQEDKDFDIVLDDDGIAKITQNVTDEIKGEYAERFDKIDGDIQEIKELIASGVTVKEGLLETVAVKRDDENKEYDIVLDDEGISKITQNVSDEIKSEYSKRFDKIDGDIEELKALIASGVVIKENSSEIAASQLETQEEVEEPESEEEELVTVSDIVETEEADEEQAAESEEDDEEDEEDDVINDIVDDIDERYVDGEIMPDGIPGISGGVDFASMMKYNRSFIARIIQGSDEQKQFYGEVKNALLSYKKVNSNIAWGAERFNKGRETIARFKIRGKTLCLYLALNPNDYKVSVYHHIDVTENKSMHGTPMMIKIKSPLGVKKAIRLIDEMLAMRDGIKQKVLPRDYAAMYPYETIDELIEDGLVKDVSKSKK